MQLLARLTLYRLAIVAHFELLFPHGGTVSTGHPKPLTNFDSDPFVG